MANWNSAAHWRKVAMVTPDTGSASLRLSILKPVEKVSGKTTISATPRSALSSYGVGGDFLVYLPKQYLFVIELHA